MKRRFGYLFNKRRGLNFLRMLVLTGIAFALPVLVFSFGKRDAGKTLQIAPKPAVPDAAHYDSVVSGQTVEITGRVRLVGSEPFPELVITDAEDHTWYIDTDDRKILSGYEQQTVTIHGTVALQEMILANGKSLGTRRTLSGITIAKVW